MNAVTAADIYKLAAAVFQAHQTGTARISSRL